METESALVMAVIFLAALVRSTLGFGDALVAMPLLTLFISPRVASPLVALCSIITATMITIVDFKKIRFTAAWRFILACGLGIPVGTLLLTEIDPRWVKGLLALVVIGFATFRVHRPQHAWNLPPAAAWLFGFVAGVLGGAYNTAGVVIVVYGALMQWDAKTFSATLQSFLLPSCLMLLTVHASRGLWTREVLHLYALCLPVMLPALLLGFWTASKLQRQRFDHPLTIILYVIGSVLLATVLWPQ